ncbi:MAG: DNA replication complex GINS family protein [Thaumarchaeota archaeon]|nr:MAG: DNA replication complex GINS family protein [Nitrososphaerota archaeon]TLX82352.1 MAG: DNA replication complex GINS family protein [Nitrososphaerota archaeon]
MSDLTQLHTIGHSLQDVKVTFNHDIKVDALDVSIDAKHGEILSIPRWVAEVLALEKLVEVQDTDMIVALKQALVKENVQGDFDLSTLDSDFYIKVNSYIERLPQQDRDKVESMLNTLMRKRQGKIIRLADSSKMTSDLAKKLSIEERALFDAIHLQSIDFKKQILGDKK